MAEEPQPPPPDEDPDRTWVMPRGPRPGSTEIPQPGPERQEERGDASPQESDGGNQEERTRPNLTP